MTTPNLFRSTPFRLSIINGFVTALLLVVAMLFLNQILHSISQARLETLLATEFDLIETAYKQNGLIGAMTELERNMKYASDEERVFAIMDDAGALIAGNIQSIPVFSGFKELPPTAFGLKSSHKFIALFRPLGDYNLVTAIELATLDQIAHSLHQSIFWASIGIGSILILIGWMIGHHTAKRLNAIITAIDSFSSGNTDQRISILSHKDDIDDIAVRINLNLDKVQEMMETVENISSEIAHDLKSPLSRLYLNLQEIASIAEPNSDIEEKVADALGQTEDIVSIFDSILDLARIESIATRGDHQQFNLEELCEDLVETYNPIAAEHDDLLTFSAGAIGVPYVIGDRRLLTQMIVNLIENSIRHTPKGTTIEIRLERYNQRLVLSIEDNGPGIPAKEHKIVFRRFFRGERSRTTPGTGIGMTLVSVIARHHDCEVTLHDTKPGVRVNIVFPLLQ